MAGRVVRPGAAAFVARPAPAVRQPIVMVYVVMVCVARMMMMMMMMS